MVASVPEAPAVTPHLSRSRLVAQSIFVAGLLADTVAFLVSLSTYSHPDSFQASPAGDVAGFVLPLCLLATGLLLRIRRPGNAIGWLLLAFGAVTTVAAVAWTVMLVNHLGGGDPGLGAFSAWFGAVFSISTFTYLIIALIVRFPQGSASTTAEARLLRWMPAYCAAVGTATALRPGPILIYAAFDNPIATPASLASALTLVSNLAGAALFIPLLAAGVGMARRYRRTTAVERLQLRWFAFGTGLALFSTAVYVVASVLLDVGANGREAAYAVFALSLTALPVAILQAIASHRLYDIDRIIGRTFAYGALTAILAGLYAASIRFFNWLFVDLTGQDSEISLVLTTLVLTTSFTPIKGRLEKQAARRLRFESTAPDAVANAPVAWPSPGVSLGGTDLAALEARIEQRVDARIDAAIRAAVRDAGHRRESDELVERVRTREAPPAR